MEPVNYWDDLIYSLQKGRCILVLGSAISTGIGDGGEEQPLALLLAQHLAEQIERKNKMVEGERNNLFQIANEYVRYFGHIALERETENFYKKPEYSSANPIQKDLASLPFKLILNAAPDDLFYKALISCTKDPAFLHYLPPGTDRGTIHKNMTKPSESNPLLYNILGLWSDSKSIVLTESAQLDYLQDVIRHNDAIPNSLLEVCRVEKSVFLFVGFDFGSWQLRLLLRALKLGGEDVNHWAVQKPATLQRETLLFFKDQYGLHFMDMDARGFVNELVRRWKETTPVDNERAEIQLHVICLYEQADEIYRKELDTHLAPLREHKHISTWDDAVIKPGEVVDEVIKSAIDKADVIIVLASADFIASESLYHEHLARAIQRFETGKAKVFPVIVRDFAWADTVIGKLPIVLPQDNGRLRPVAEWPQRDRAYAEIVKLILRHIKFLMDDLKTTA